MDVADEAATAADQSKKVEPSTEAIAATSAPTPFKRLEPHELYSCEQLVQLFRSLCPNLPEDHSPVVGMVGYPNVCEALA